jgi:hypothetical protein
MSALNVITSPFAALAIESRSVHVFALPMAQFSASLLMGSVFEFTVYVVA